MAEEGKKCAGLNYYPELAKFSRAGFNINRIRDAVAPQDDDAGALYLACKLKSANATA